MISDLNLREQALDASQSFIVQAPAGSGKTELLTRRFLKLLALVEHPEEVLAITFTRKAAGEMRERITSALASVNASDNSFKLDNPELYEYAQAAVDRDQVKGWNLLATPARLRIQTIDSLCSSLVRQFPIDSGLGGVGKPTENALALYQQAARNTILEIESRETWSDSLDLLFSHLDNDLRKIESLIVSMLAKRDQWLRHVTGSDGKSLDREDVEFAVSLCIENELALLFDRIPEDTKEPLLGIVRRLASIQKSTLYDGYFPGLEALSSLPPAAASAVEQWQVIGKMLLGSAGEWRKTLNATMGLPKANEVRGEEKKYLGVLKEDYKQLLTRLGEEELLKDQWLRVLSLPCTNFSDQQWTLLEALMEVLLLSAAHLRLVFSKYGEIDFNELGMLAPATLGDAETYTELALKLDYSLRHILIDEFQDTSINQFSLFEKLVSNWQKGDGKTLFLVGDPMQSIYRFREAEVGLFLRAWSQGMGGVELLPVRLSANFRSQAGLIDWFNARFESIFPKENDLALGSICYAPSIATKPAVANESVILKLHHKGDLEKEAREIINIVREELAKGEVESIGILARSRSHLNNITRILRDERISFSALDIDAMIETPLIVDLLSITRALINPADRVAWISLLRSPICGIDLQELESMYQVLSKQIAFSTLLSEKWKVAVSSDSVFRIERLLNAFSSAYQLRGRAKLHHIVLHLWEVLAVSAVYSSNDDHEILMQYVHKLSQYEPIGTIEDFRNFESALGTLYANTDSAQASKVHIMTIHKSKGLQFDIVILPSLERRPRGDESKLLQWQEITHQDGTSLAIAPIKTVGGKDAHYELLSHIDKRKQGYELTRLLYVAVTRAKIRLYLSASVELDDSSKSIKSVDKSSLFYLLKPTLEPEIRLEIKNMFTDAVSEKEGVSFKADVLRLTSESLPPYDYVLYSREETFADIQDRLLSTENQDSRYLGIMVHKGLEIIVKAKMVHWSERSGALLEMVFSQQCRELCLDKGKAAALTRQALSCIQAALRNDKASWILSSSHKDSKAEWEISGVDHKGEIRKYVVDRSFVDQGVRWVIDYKTAARGELDLEKFLRSEKEKYRGQLENYARLINGFECLPVQLGLYFPVEGAFIDWEFNSETR